MARRITAEDQAPLKRPVKEVLADLSEQHPEGLAEIGIDTLTVSGGGDPLDRNKSRLGKWWKCVVHDLKMPMSSNPLPVRVSSDVVNFYKVIRTNRVVTLPDAAINSLINNAVATNKIRVRQSSPLFGKDEAAMQANEGCEVMYEKGNMFLIRKRPRFAVERRELLPGPPAGPLA